MRNSALCAARPRLLRTPQLGGGGRAHVPLSSSRLSRQHAEGSALGSPRTGKWTSNLRASGSGGWRGEPAREIKGQNGENLCTMRKRKLKSWSSVPPERAGPRSGETGGSCWSWEGPKAEAFGETSMALSTTTTSSPKAEKQSSVPPSIRAAECGTSRQGRRRARPPGSLPYWATAAASESAGLPLVP